MEARADQCIAALDALKCDPSMLLYVRRCWDLLALCKYGAGLLQFLETNMRLRRAEVEDDAFHARVAQVVRERGIRAVAPLRTAHAYTMDKLWAAVDAQDWPSPHFPFVIQLWRPNNQCAGFVAFSSWQDGFRKIAEIAFKGEYLGYKISKIYEKQLYGPERALPSRPIIDAEISTGELGGRMTAEELEATFARFPAFWAQELYRMGVVSPRDPITIVQKTKTRAVQGGGVKVSSHFILNAVAFPREIMQRVMHDMFGKHFAKERAVYKKNRNWDHLDLREGLPMPLLTDTAAQTGCGQFSTLFSRKNGEERNPALLYVYRTASAQSVMAREPAPWFGQDHAPSHPDALRMLALACFSNPLADMVSVTPNFIKSFNRNWLPRNPEVSPSARARHEIRTHDAPQTVTGKKCWGVCWTKKHPPGQPALVPARVVQVRLGTDWGQGKHKHALSGEALHGALCIARGRGVCEA